MSDLPPPAPSEVAEEIEREILRVHVHIGGDFVFVILDVELTQAERTLIDAEHAEAVKATREAYQKAIAATFSAVVERATGRRVAGFLSAMSIEPLYSAEVFRLAPRTETGA